MCGGGGGVEGGKRDKEGGNTDIKTVCQTVSLEVKKKIENPA